MINTRCVQRTRESHKERTDFLTFYNKYPYQDDHNGAFGNMNSILFK